MDDQQKIDAVLTWVDGNDPVLKAERNRYLTDKHEDSFEDIAGRERYIQSDEIRFAVASILRFAPFIGRIFIITDRQRPDLDGFVKTNFPDNEVPVIIVDHSVLFEGWQQYLPVFNSIAIETMMWRIPGLTERFVYLNDDTFFAAPIRIEDLFVDDKVVCRSKTCTTWKAKFIRAVRRKKNGHKRFTYKDSLLNGAEIAGVGRFFQLPHNPHPIFKSVLKSFFDAHPECIERNVRHKFRDYEQFNVQGLFYLLAERQGRLIHRSHKGLTLFIRRMKSLEYVKAKLDKADARLGLRFGCINALSEADPETKRLCETWISNRLRVSL